MKTFLFFFLAMNFVFAATDLKLVSPIVNQMKLDQPVQADVQLNGNFLMVNFNVLTEHINGKPHFTKNEYPFQYDVVELFLSVEDNLYPYYEFEVSPYDQVFVVKIPAAKKFVNNAKVEWTHLAEITAHGWRATMTIDLSKLGWSGDISKIKGNLYAILGQAPNRHYWSLSLPKMKKVNFHLPQYFVPLIGKDR